MNWTERQHWVPRTYLRSWAISAGRRRNKAKVIVFDKQLSRCSPSLISEIFFERNLYETEQFPGNYLENELQKIEDDFPSHRAEIVKREPLSAQARNYLDSFVALMWLRNPAWRAAAEDAIGGRENRTGLPPMLLDIEAASSRDRNFVAGVLVKNYARKVDELGQMSLRRHFSKSEFITSDRPVRFNSPGHNYGWHQFANVPFPVSKTVRVLYNFQGNNDCIEVPNYFTLYANWCTYIWAERWVISSGFPGALPAWACTEAQVIERVAAMNAPDRYIQQITDIMHRGADAMLDP